MMRPGTPWRHAAAVACVLATAIDAPATAADLSPPDEVYELRARDPQQDVPDPKRFLWPEWQEARRVSIYGWVDCGIGGNTNGSAYNGTVGLQDRNLQAMMSQLYLVAERSLDFESDDWQWGARVDLLYGTDAWQTLARGLDAYPFNEYDNFGVPRWDSSRFYDLAMPQLYAEIGRGDVAVLAGHVYSPLGYENVPAVGNFFYSHSYTFNFATPNTVTGVIARWEPEEGVRVSSGVTNGWDNFSDGMPVFDNPGYPGASSNLAYLGNAVLASPDGKQLVSIAVSTGNEYTPVVDPSGAPGRLLVGNRSMVTAFWQNELADRLTSVAQWYGVCQYLYRGLTDRLSAGSRLEWFRDNNGSRTAYPARNAALGMPPVASGFAGNFWEVTLGLNWVPSANWVIRPEVRYDWYTPDDYGTGALPFGPLTTTPVGLVTGDAFDQWYMGCDAILQF
ncbi:MAG: hypothetical protein EBS51_03910 [Planctomycetia bacterium]|nr:hypothetical protein [Planctomycetia bacterium]